MIFQIDFTKWKSDPRRPRAPAPIIESEEDMVSCMKGCIVITLLNKGLYDELIISHASENLLLKTSAANCRGFRPGRRGKMEAAKHVSPASFFKPPFQPKVFKTFW